VSDGRSDSADVQAAAADRLARRRQARDVAEFAEHGGGRDRADAVLAHQGLTAGLPARQPGEFALERHELAVELIDDRQRDLDPLQRRGRQRERVQERAPVGP